MAIQRKIHTQCVCRWIALLRGPRGERSNAKGICVCILRWITSEADLLRWIARRVSVASGAQLRGLVAASGEHALSEHDALDAGEQGEAAARQPSLLPLRAASWVIQASGVLDESGIAYADVSWAPLEPVMTEQPSVTTSPAVPGGGPGTHFLPPTWAYPGIKVSEMVSGPRPV